jgi:hypothetical protein
MKKKKKNLKKKKKKKNELRGQNAAGVFGANFAYWPDLRTGLASAGRFLGLGSCGRLWKHLVLAPHFLENIMVFAL